MNFAATLVLPDFDASAWAVSAIMRGPGQINLNATGSGTQHAFSVNAGATSSWAPGEYWVSIRATKGADVVEVALLQLSVTPNLASVTTPYDGRSQNQIALDAINAVLAKRATRDQERYTIHNRELWRTPIPDLLKLRAFYTVQVRRERNAAKGVSGFGRQIAVRFSNK